MVSGLEASATATFGNLLETQILGPAPDALNQKLWGGAQHSRVTSFPGDSRDDKNREALNLGRPRELSKLLMPGSHGRERD